MKNNLTQDDFVVIAANALIEMGENGKSLSSDMDKFRLVKKDEVGNPIRELNLGNFYIRYKQAANEEERAQALEGMRPVWFSIEGAPDSFEEVKPFLRPAVRERFFFHRSNPELALPQIEVGDFLTTLLAIDRPEHLIFVTDSDLTNWGVTFFDALEVAQNNLEAQGPFNFEVRQNPDDEEDRCYVLDGDCYTSAVATFPGVLTELPVLGERLVILPHRNVLLVTGSASIYGLQETLSIVDELDVTAEALVPELLAMDENLYYFSCELDVSHPLALEFKRRRLRYLNNIYPRLKEQINSQFEQIVDAKRFLDYKLLEGEDRAFSQVMLLDDEAPVIIPRVDFIGVFDGKTICATPSWDRFAEVAGEKLRWREGFPETYDLVETLTEAEIADLGTDPFFET